LVEDSGKTVLHVIVREPKHMKLAESKRVFAPCVFFPLVLMYGAVHLHDESGIQTEEIDDEAVDDLLSAKVIAAETPASQILPKNGFGRSHLPPKLLRKVTFLDFVLAKHDARATNEN
jgi:hypothetical protein